MKEIKSAVLIFIVLGIISCGNDAKEENYTTAQTTEIQPAYDTNQIEIERQRVKQAYEDSLAKAIQAAKIEEDKAYKFKRLESIVSDFTARYAKKNSPVSARNIQYEIINQTYNELTGTATMTFKSMWDAYVYGILDNEARPHIFTGELT